MNRSNQIKESFFYYINAWILCCLMYYASRKLSSCDPLAPAPAPAPAPPPAPSPKFWVVHERSYKISESQHLKNSINLTEIWYFEEGGFSREVRRMGLETAPLTSSSIEVMNAWTCICTWVTCTRLNGVCCSEHSTVSSKTHQAYSLFEFLTDFSVYSGEFWDNSTKWVPIAILTLVTFIEHNLVPLISPFYEEDKRKNVSFSTYLVLIWTWLFRICW
jgi:hypothetical protein